MDNWQERIVGWASDPSRDLIENSTPKLQLIKLDEEIGELEDAIACEDAPDIDDAKDAIGDATVVLTIMAAQMGLTLAECMEHAWQQIKDRTGKNVGGVFVKSEDLG